MARDMACFFVGLLMINLAVTTAQAHPHNETQRGKQISPRERLFSKDKAERPNTIFDEIVTQHLDPSYITLYGGQDFENNLKFDDILYEAELNLNYVWWKTSNEKSRTHHFQVHVPIRIQVRQFTSRSSPVKTPSYNPGLRFFYWTRAWEKAHSFGYLSLGFHHYSNGQRGPHFNADGSINTETGSFSSEYAELAFHHVGRHWFTRYSRLALRRYINGGWGTWEPEQDDQYPTSVLYYTTHFHPFFEESPLPTSLRMTVGYKMGRDLILKNPVDNSRNVDTDLEDNIQLKFEALLSPKHWTDLSLYLRYDYGYDYYNINYQNRVSRIQFGFVSHPFLD